MSDSNTDINAELFNAVKNGEIDKVKSLISDGADVNATDQSGKTPLHWAALSGKEKVVEFLLSKKADVNATDQSGKTPLDLTTNDEIIALLNKAAEDPDAGSVDEPSTDSKEDQEEDAGTEKKEKQEGNAQPGSDITNQEADETVSSGSGTPQTQQGTISAGEGTQTEEHSSSLFGSLFSILMKPFSLIASFFGGFFSWLFGSNEEKSDEFTTDALLKLDSSDKEKTDLQPNEDHLLG